MHMGQAQNTPRRLPQPEPGVWDTAKGRCTTSPVPPFRALVAQRSYHRSRWQAVMLPAAAAAAQVVELARRRGAACHACTPRGWPMLDALHTPAQHAAGAAKHTAWQLCAKGGETQEAKGREPGPQPTLVAACCSHKVPAHGEIGCSLTSTWQEADACAVNRHCVAMLAVVGPGRVLLLLHPGLQADGVVERRPGSGSLEPREGPC
jgi:hypothetical protein